MHGRNRDPNDNSMSYQKNERGHEFWGEPGDPDLPVDVGPDPEPDPTGASGTKPNPEE